MTGTAVEKLLEWLKSRKPGKERPTDRWYKRSYRFLVQNRPVSAEVLVHTMAAAGSWVHLIPTACPGKDKKAIRRLSECLRILASGAAGRSMAGLRQDVLRAAQEAYGLKRDSEAVVVLSKALHFLRPRLVPMIDTNIARAWKSLTRKKRFKWLVARFKTRSLISAKRPTQGDFLNYWDIAHCLTDGGRRLSYRELDEYLFSYARSLPRRRKSRRP